METMLEPPKPPTLSQMQELLPGLQLYNPSPEWLPLEVHGRTDLWLPPDLNGAVEPHRLTGEPTVCDGIMEIKGRYHTQKDSSGKTIEGQDARAVVLFAIHKDRYGMMGVVWLPGKPELDAQHRATGRKLFLQYQQDKDEKIIGKRREFKANWDRSPTHQGQSCPPPTVLENAAMDRYQEREHEKAYMYECDAEDCPGYAANDWEKFRRHMASAHKIEPKRAQYEGDVGVVKVAKAPETEAAPKPKQRRGRKKKVA